MMIVDRVGTSCKLLGVHRRQVSVVEMTIVCLPGACLRVDIYRVDERQASRHSRVASMIQFMSTTLLCAT